MGRLLGIPHFLSEDSYQEEKDDLANMRKARKLDDDGFSMRKIQVEAARRMQRQFRGFILRRTTDSRNWLGKTLLDLPPHKDIIGVITLTERERRIMNARAEDAKAS